MSKHMLSMNDLRVLFEVKFKHRQDDQRFLNFAASQIQIVEYYKHRALASIQKVFLFKYFEQNQYFFLHSDIFILESMSQMIFKIEFNLQTLKFPWRNSRNSGGG